MATNRKLIEAALKLIGVTDAEQTANISDATLGLEELNNLMSDLAGEGIDLAFPPQDQLSDEFPMDEQVYGQIKPILAMYLLTSFPGSTPAPMLPERASAAKQRLLLNSVLGNIQEADTSFLPRGAGNCESHNIYTDT